MRTPYSLPLSRLAAITCSLVLFLGLAARAGTSAGDDQPPALRSSGGITSQGNVSPPASPDLPSSSSDVFAQQSILLFFAVFILAVSGLRGKGVISPLAAVRLLGSSMVLATSIFLAFSRLEPGRLMPVVVLLGVSLGLFFSRTEGAEPEKREHLTKPPATRDASQVDRPSNGQGQVGIPASRLQEAEENSDASGSSSL